MEGFGGYTLDQRGGRGPFYGSRSRFIGLVRAQAGYDRRLNSVATGPGCDPIRRTHPLAFFDGEQSGTSDNPWG